MTDQTPSQKPDLRDQLINALGQTDTIPPIAHRRAQADNVLAVLYREWPWLRAAAEDASPVPGSEREQRIRLDDLTSDALDALYEQLAALRQVARGYCPTCGRGDADPTVADWEQQKKRADHAEATLEVLRTALASIKASGFSLTPDYLLRLISQESHKQSGSAATGADDIETTARVFAALHRSAEQDVTRVIALYEQWVKAGPPPLGTPTSRWWDARLAELHNTIRPPTNQPEHHTGTTPANQTAPYDQTNRPNQHRT